MSTPIERDAAIASALMTYDAAIESAWQEYASAQKTYDTTEETT